jgi:hypothetical protein
MHPARFTLVASPSRILGPNARLPRGLKVGRFLECYERCGLKECCSSTANFLLVAEYKTPRDCSLYLAAKQTVDHLQLRN